MNDSTAWFAANRGVWGFTENGGKTWHVDSIKVNSIYPEFRSMAVLDDSTVLLLSVASPAYLFKTTNKGKSWKLVYNNKDKNIFFDSMKFSDAKNGIAIADPIDGWFQVILTQDGGENWELGTMPAGDSGEALFASSNTNIAMYKDMVWYATGGKKANVFHTCPHRHPGGHFAVYKAPIAKGEKFTGIFSIDFINYRRGIIAGGNYEKTDTSIVSLAFTRNGGKTWKEIKGKKPFFGSCVKLISENSFFVTGHDGTYFGNLKTKKIIEAKDRSGVQLKFYTLRFSSSGKTMWLAGNNGRIAFINFTL